MDYSQIQENWANMWIMKNINGDDNIRYVVCGTLLERKDVKRRCAYCITQKGEFIGVEFSADGKYKLGERPIHEKPLDDVMARNLGMATLAYGASALFSYFMGIENPFVTFMAGTLVAMTDMRMNIQSDIDEARSDSYARFLYNSFIEQP